VDEDWVSFILIGKLERINGEGEEKRFIKRKVK